MRKPLIVVKLGGSALTDKRRIYTPRVQIIRKAANQIAEIRKRFSIVIVHGAGSYGHIPVKRWKLQSGFKNRTQLRALAATKSKLLEWETIFDTIFLERRVPLVPLLASDFVVTRRGRISSADLSPLLNWLRMGCVPSTGGDIVTDLRNGFSVLSGDQLAAYLAVKLKAARLIFATDVDGIFGSNPKLDSHALMLGELSSGEALRITSRAGASTAPDVTGGMAGKIAEAVGATSKGIPVYFINLTEDRRLAKVALGQEVQCSKILPDTGSQ